ncbi:2-phosphosulfolactate phosphatase [Microbacter sp. GSS18]|nr:2-phosphosulfolactate phosphatase [Microbacter sp. GSS18]
MPDHISSPYDQQRYQVRHEWGVIGLGRLAPADVVVVVDVLRYSTAVTGAVAAGERVLLDDDAHAVSLNGAPIVGRAAETAGLVMLGCLRNASAVAQAIADEQDRRGERTSVAVIAAGERIGSDVHAPVRFAVEDLLGAGAVIDALAEHGIDHTSPEAAAAGESFRGLGGSMRHLIAASGSGQELIGLGEQDDVLHATEVDVDVTVPVLDAGYFRAL